MNLKPTTLLSLTSSLTYTFLFVCTQAQAAPSFLARSDNSDNSGDQVRPHPGSEAPLSKEASTDRAYLSAQIGGIVGAYAISLVLVAVTLLCLSKKRREHLNAGNDEVDFSPGDDVYALDEYPRELKNGGLTSVEEYSKALFVSDFSEPSPSKTEFSLPGPGSFVHHSPASSLIAPGVSPLVDQEIVFQDRIMAQSQLEEMYKHVMEHEAAKQKGITYDAPGLPASVHPRYSASDKSVRSATSKKERAKPANLNLDDAKEDAKKGSKTSGLLSALKSPKKKSKAVNISSPIMTPQTSTFPTQLTQEDSRSMPFRHYAPMPPPPPVPQEYHAYQPRTSIATITPDISPESVQSIDERLGSQFAQVNRSRNFSSDATEVDPDSAVSEHSQAPLVGLPASPRRPSGKFPSLPQSPKPGATFSRPNAPSAVRTGGSLPLRSYEPAMVSPTTIAQTTKQTVFERKGPLSPLGTARTPGTSVPYSPYQPFTPCMPVTPGLVTKGDRRRFKRMVPKTPTLEMVRGEDDVW